MNLKGIYDSATLYSVGDVVKNPNDELWYILQKPCKAGTAPVDTLYWNRASAMLSVAAEMANDLVVAIEAKADKEDTVLSSTLTIGETTLTEEQLTALLALLETPENPNDAEGT